jgi:hypothetical protein
VAHLAPEKFQAFIRENIYKLDYSSYPSFDLRVWWGLGRHLWITVKEVEPFGSQLLEHDAHRIWPQTDDNAQVERIALPSPPLVPDFRFAEQDCKELQDQVKQWLSDMLQDKRGEIVWQCMWEDHEKYQREVLLDIWDFYHEVLNENNILKDALRFLVLNHCMTRALLVPDEDLKGLWGQLRNQDFLNNLPQSGFSPKTVERAVKMCIYPLVKHLAETTTKHFIDSCYRKTESCVEKDLSFCLGFILLAVLGMNQGAVFGLAEINETRRNEGLKMAEAKELIQAMETEFADHIIRLCQYRFAPSQKRRNAAQQPETRAVLFDLIGRVQRLTTEAGKSSIFQRSHGQFAHEIVADDLTLTREIHGFDETTFIAMNRGRLLVKFIRGVYPEWFDPSCPSHKAQ